MTEIRVPTLGESVTEATIGRWFKKAGDPVAVDEPLVELETDKVTSRSARCSDRSMMARQEPPSSRLKRPPRLRLRLLRRHRPPPRRPRLRPL